MNADTEKHACYVESCSLAVDAAAASAAARAAWKKLRLLERKAADLFAAAYHAHDKMGDAAAAEGLKKASRKHWQASYVAEAGYQKVYEGRS